MLRAVGKGLGVLVATFFVVIVVALGASAVARSQTRHLAAPTGPHAVGRIELALTDPARSDPFASTTHSRELSVWIWYPTAEEKTAATAPYLPKAWADAANSVNGPAAVFFQDHNAVRTNSVASASLD